jgi:ankyrin repeat protein
MRIYSARSTRSGLRESAERIVLVFCYFAAWAVVPLMAFWPPGDSDPQATAMFQAAQRGNVAAIEKILRGGLDVNCRDETGITPLMAAARAGQLDAVLQLLDAGGSVNASANVSGTPLMMATASGQHAVMRELINHAADVNAVSSTGQTALWFARSSGDAATVRILTAAGAVAEGRCSMPGESGVISR